MKRISSVKIIPSSGICKTKFAVALVSLALITCLVGQTALAAPADDFVTTWKTDNPGTSNFTSITVPMVGGPYDVDWDNDGTFDEFGLNDSVVHDYGVVGTYTIRIRGEYESICICNGADKEKNLSIDQWGTQSWASMSSAFWGAWNLTIPATDTPNFSAVTDMSWMFSGATSANPDTSGWDTSSVTNMSEMFSGATSANPDTSEWDTEAVIYMAWMFWNATSANPDTSGWDTSSVINMGWMFSDATSSNPDTSGWDTSSVARMDGMFSNNPLANPDTSGWDTSSVTMMDWMFSGATSANPDTSGWDTSLVFNMSGMFSNNALANPDTSEWDTSSVIGMSEMFFDATSANPDTSGWDTAAVADMRYMFWGATSFDQDIGSWDVTSLKLAWEMFTGVTLSSANYESLLIGWNAQALQSGVTFSGGSSKYCSAAAITARANMVESDAWIITDGGNDCTPVFKINAGLNDAWYFPDTSGQGFFITVFPDLGYVSLAWFTYDTELPPIDAVANLGDAGHRWITGLGSFVDNQVVMNVTITSGGIFDTTTEIQRTDPPGSDGTIILTFDSCNSGTVEYDITSINRQGIIPIKRVADDNIVICEALKAD